MTERAEVDIRTAVLEDEVVQLQVAGDVDLLTVPCLARALAAAARLSPRRVEVDLSAVDFLSVSGAAELALAAVRMPVQVRPASRASRATLTATGLDHLLG
ncbi:STAS domain-containing protein [Amycolatopsis viridis]|uniref:Anti-anti-sigma regulatory factor n=1 Tax=Amycolatopsis viridis TaxID=185678 RepID=A0ABX0SWQ9_9PSEU|nr:STAS domain-containing protein [Amycolatopsis viridis]NIH81387.1 anti-anti-sigma regulatory factor [Amycolatopsis viridis]